MNENQTNNQSPADSQIAAPLFKGIGLFLLLLLIAFILPDFIKIRTKTYTRSCHAAIERAEAAVAEFNIVAQASMNIPGNPVDLRLLRNKNYISKISLCPENGRYLFDSEGKIYCEKHGRKGREELKK